MRLTEQMRALVRQQGLGFVATVWPDGTPAVSPKGTTIVWGDDRLAFLHLHSAGTVANLRRNPAVEVNVVDPVRRTGWRFAGRGTVHTGGPEHAAVVDHFERHRGICPERVQAVVLIQVEYAEELLSPAYDDGTPEAEASSPSEPSGTRLTRCQAEAALASQPFSRLLGTRVTGFGNGRATLQLLATEDLRQQDGHVHGGVLSYLADNAMAFAAGTELGPAVLTAGMTIEYLRPARAAVLRATGVVVHAGRRQVTCRCDVVTVDAAGDTSLCATAQGRARLAPS